jgi:hypothetical protein
MLALNLRISCNCNDVLLNLIILQAKLKNSPLTVSYVDERDTADRWVFQVQESSPAGDFAVGLGTFKISHRHSSTTPVPYSGELIAENVNDGKFVYCFKT